MPKLSSFAKNIPALLSLTLFVVIVAVAGYVFYVANSNDPDQKQAKETLEKVGIRSTFAGSITAVDSSTKTLDVKNNNDGVIYEVRLDKAGKLTADSKNIEFAELKVGDSVSVYSKQSNNPTTGKVYVADLITKMVPVDPNTIAPLQ